MACASLFPSLDSSSKASQQLMCSICLDLYKDPVTTTCGHTFCMACFKRNHAHNDLVCPLCKDPLAGSRTPKVNVVLKALVEEELAAQRRRNARPKDAYTGAVGEVPCDVCPGSCKLRAIKSCLVCLSSYCEGHLEQHTERPRLRGHKLVAPLADLDQRACPAHGRALELYRPQSRGWDCVCALCVEEGDVVIATETACERKKAELQKTKTNIKDKIQERVKKLKELQTLALDCKTHIDAEMTEVKGVFVEVMEAVRRAKEEALRPLEERKRRVEEEELELRQELQEEIRTLEDTVTELTQLQDLEDHIHFLQSHPIDPAPKEERDWTDVTMDTDLSFGSLRNIWTSMVAEIQDKLEKLTTLEISRIQKFIVDVTLDSDTANPHLIVSDDQKEVSHADEKLDVPDGPQRFDVFGSVLGRDPLVSGRAYWEVEVGGKTGWDVGVASEEANRKGAISFKPSEGYWALVLYGEGRYAALADPSVSLSLQAKPQKIGVFVDHEQGLVSFYDVEVKGHIYSFTGCSFSEGLKLFPYFSPHLPQGEQNSEPLVISPVKQQA